MPMIPVVTVRKMMGLINNFTMLMKMPLENSLNVVLILRSWPMNLISHGLFSICFNAKSGAYWPTKIPAVIAINTQKVRLEKTFLIITGEEIIV